MLLGIKWHQFVRNDEVRRLTGQPELTAIVQSLRLTLGTLRVRTITQMPRESCQLSLQRTGGDHEEAPHHMAEHHTAGSEISQSHTV